MLSFVSSQAIIVIVVLLICHIRKTQLGTQSTAFRLDSLDSVQEWCSARSTRTTRSRSRTTLASPATRRRSERLTKPGTSASAPGARSSRRNTPSRWSSQHRSRCSKMCRRRCSTPPCRCAILRRIIRSRAVRCRSRAASLARGTTSAAAGSINTASHTWCGQTQSGLRIRGPGMLPRAREQRRSSRCSAARSTLRRATTCCAPADGHARRRRIGGCADVEVQWALRLCASHGARRSGGPARC